MTYPPRPLTPGELQGHLLHRALLASARAEVAAYHAYPFEPDDPPPSASARFTRTGSLLAVAAEDD